MDEIIKKNKSFEKLSFEPTTSVLSRPVLYQLSYTPLTSRWFVPCIFPVQNANHNDLQIDWKLKTGPWTIVSNATFWWNKVCW